ncbi:MAG: hypothetical protein QF357_05840 [Dehalococcoidia bacterium]|nr:hypothetical protein [Dehalococcoidia bacterium]
MIDIEDNKNSGYFPIQVFETQGASRSAAVIIVPGIPGSDDPHEVVGGAPTKAGNRATQQQLSSAIQVRGRY